MPVLRDEDGNVVEDVMPKAEAEALAKKAADDATAAANQDKAKLQADLDKVNADLKKATEGDKNWNDLRTAKEELEGKIGELSKKVEEKDQKEKTQLSSKKESMILELADGNKDEAAKIKLIYDQQTAGAEDSEESIRVRANNAYVLYKQQANKEAGLLGSDAISSGGGGSAPRVKGPLSSDAKSLASRMGLGKKVEKYEKKHNQGGK